MKKLLFYYVLLAISSSYGFLSSMVSNLETTDTITTPRLTSLDLNNLLNELEWPHQEIVQACRQKAHKNPLTWAAGCGHFMVIKKLLARGFDPNYCPPDQPTAMRNIFNCQFLPRIYQSLEELLNAGASLYQSALRQEKILECSASACGCLGGYCTLCSRQRSTIKLLIDFGADIRSTVGEEKAAFGLATKVRNFKDALALVWRDVKYDITKFMQEAGSHATYYRVYNPILTWLLLNNCSQPKSDEYLNKLLDELSFCPGIWACITGDYKMAKKRVKSFDKSETPSGLHWAAARGHEHIVELLLKKKHNPNSEYFKGITPADLALRNNHQACLERILAAGGKLQTEGLLHRAIITKHSDKIYLLLKYHPHMVSERDGFGHTPLHTALSTYAPDWDLINKLLDQDIEAQFIANKSNVTPLRLLYTIAPKEYFYRRACTALTYSMKFLSKSSDDFVRQLSQDMPELVYCMAQFLVGQCTRDGNGQLYKPFFRALRAVRLVTSGRIPKPEL